MCLCLSIAFSSALLCLSIAFSSALLCLSIFDTVLAVPKLPLSPFLLSHVHCFVSVLLSQLPCSVSVSLTPFLSLLCPSCLVTVLLLSHVHCFVSALRRSYVVSVSRCSCSLMCLALSSSASRGASLMCFALSQHHVAHMLCLALSQHAITPSRRSSVLCLFQATRS